MSPQAAFIHVHLIAQCIRRQRRGLGLDHFPGIHPQMRSHCWHRMHDATLRRPADRVFDMAALTIRNLPDEVRERLRLRAAKAGRSMEAEVRAILTEASLAESRRGSADALQAWVDKLYGKKKPRGVVDELIAERRREASSE